jgi:transcriptional/translational regulatory protein YebC/TACO1
VREELVKRKINVENAEITMIPKTPATLSNEDAIQTMKLMDQLEELDDVQKVMTNADISEDLMEQFEGA